MKIKLNAQQSKVMLEIALPSLIRIAKEKNLRSENYAKAN